MTSVQVALCSASRSLLHSFRPHVSSGMLCPGSSQAAPSEAANPLASSLVLKRLPPRCSTGTLLEVLDAISARHLPALWPCIVCAEATALPLTAGITTYTCLLTTAPTKICQWLSSILRITRPRDTFFVVSVRKGFLEACQAACVAFQRLLCPSDFPDAFAPSTKAIWGEIHGLGPNLAHFLVRYGVAALDPPYAPLVFLNQRCVPQTKTILRWLDYNVAGTF